VQQICYHGCSKDVKWLVQSVKSLILMGKSLYAVSFPDPGLVAMLILTGKCSYAVNFTDPGLVAV
jgi:hypothetical protein